MNRIFILAIISLLLLSQYNIVYAVQDPDSVDLRISQTEGDGKLEALMEAAKSYQGTSLKLALRYADQRYEIAKSLNNPVAVAENYNLYGNLYYTSGLASQAEEYYLKAYAIYDSLNHFEGLATECHNLALVHHTRDDTLNSLKLYNESVAVRKMSGNTRRIGDGLTTLGEVHLEYGNYEVSLRNLYQAIEYYGNITGYPRRIDCIAFIADNLNILSPEQAPYWIRKLEEENSIVGSKSYEQMINLRWATYYLAVKDLDRCEEYIKKVRTDSVYIVEVISPVTTFLKLSDTFLENGDTEKGLHYSRLARKLHMNQERHHTVTMTSEFKTRFNLRISEEELQSLNEINRLSAERIQIEERIKYVMIGALALVTLLLLNLMISHLSVRRNAGILTTRKHELEAAYERNLRYKEKILKTRASKNMFFRMISGRLQIPFERLTRSLEKLLVLSQNTIARDQFLSSLREIVATGDYIEKNLKRILLWSKLQRGKYTIKKSTIQLNDFMHDQLPEMLGKAVKNDVRVRFDIDPEVSVSYDRHSLKSVIRILVENAISHSPAKSDVIIRGQRATSGSVISITDFGKGIPVSLQDKIFDIERDPSGKEGPLGIGLLIAKHLAELNGSWLSFQTKPGTETTFFLHITDNNG
ncbi:MAG: tetratricopeptide repeat-containing sensor histidine kinase [Bacteroidales bacterium]|nr:tetratricopeptide repeat-containing sensor histidine kinase [Bacteroidales bacterium]